MDLIREALDELQREDREVVSEKIVNRAMGNVAGIGAAGKYLWNRVSGHKDRNQGSFRETMRNARFAGTIKSHAQEVNNLVQEINQFIAQQQEQGKDTSELENISNGITEFFKKNEKIFGLGLGDANAEDYKNQELPQQETSNQPEAPTSKDGLPTTYRGGPIPKLEELYPKEEVQKRMQQEAEGQQNGQGAPEEKQPQEAEAPAPEQPGQNQQQEAPEETPANQTQQPEGEVAEQPEQPAQQATPNAEQPVAQQQQAQQPAQQQPAPQPQQQPQQPQQQQEPPRRKKKSGFWTDNNVWLNARHESTALECLYGQILLSESEGEKKDSSTTISSLYNKVMISEAQQPQQQLPPDVNNAIAQVYAKLGDLADSGNEEDKDFVYQLIQKMAQGTPMQEILKELEARGNQEKQQAQQQPQEEVNEGFSDMRRKFYARQAGKEAAKAGGDRKAAQKEAYDNRIFEFQTRLDRALGELSLDLKTMGYKQQGGDADKLILAFRKAVSQFSKSKKEEGETSWLQRRRHGLGHALATSATYAALRTICPATILGNKYFARGLYGAATSVIRDVSRGNLNKKSILRALVGAGIAVGGTIAGEMISSPKVDLKDIDVSSSTQSRAMGTATGIGNWSGHNGAQMTYKGTYGTAGNLGTKIRALFDKDLRSKLGLNLKGGATSYGYSGRWDVKIPTGGTDHWGNPEFEYGVKNLTFDDFAERANQTAKSTIGKLIDAGVPEDDAKKMVGKELKDLLAHYKNLAATGGNTGTEYDSEGFKGMLNSLKAAKEAGSGAAEAATESATDAATEAATGTAADTAANAGNDVTLSTQSGMPVTVKGLKPGENPYDVINRVKTKLGAAGSRAR